MNPVKLTEAEQELLEPACSGSGEYLCIHRTIHHKTGQPVGGEMCDVVEQIITDRLAPVYALHRPSDEPGPYCVGCWEAGGEDGAPVWPCPTLQALGVTE